MQIVNLVRVPEHSPVVAAWIHDAFWQDSDQPVAFIKGLLAEHLTGKPIPTTLVAIEAEVPVGSVCLIESDMAERPSLIPWLAAFYVRPAHRRRGIGSRLIMRLIDHTANAGFDQVYLSVDDQVALYARHGFATIETGVGPHNLTIMRQQIGKGKPE